MDCDYDDREECNCCSYPDSSCPPPEVLDKRFAEYLASYDG